MTFKVFSLGCKVNSYECSAIASALLARGYKEDNDNPDDDADEGTPDGTTLACPVSVSDISILHLHFQ